MVNGALLAVAVLLLVVFCIVWWPAVLLVLSAACTALLRVRLVNQMRTGGRQR